MHGLLGLQQHSNHILCLSSEMRLARSSRSRAWLRVCVCVRLPQESICSHQRDGPVVHSLQEFEPNFPVMIILSFLIDVSQIHLARAVLLKSEGGVPRGSSHIKL